MYDIQGHAGQIRSIPREKSVRFDKLRTDLKESEIIHQPKNDENFTSLINAGRRLNASILRTSAWEAN